MTNNHVPKSIPMLKSWLRELISQKRIIKYHRELSWFFCSPSFSHTRYLKYFVHFLSSIIVRSETKLSIYLFLCPPYAHKTYNLVFFFFSRAKIFFLCCLVLSGSPLINNPPLLVCVAIMWTCNLCLLFFVQKIFQLFRLNNANSWFLSKFYFIP